MKSSVQIVDEEVETFVQFTAPPPKKGWTMTVLHVGKL